MLTLAKRLPEYVTHSVSLCQMFVWLSFCDYGLLLFGYSSRLSVPFTAAAPEMDDAEGLAGTGHIPDRVSGSSQEEDSSHVPGGRYIPQTDILSVTLSLSSAYPLSACSCRSKTL